MVDSHKHEWIFEEHESTIEYEDGALYIMGTCEYVDERVAARSERHDEVYYETVDSCPSTISIRYEPVKIEYEDDETLTEIEAGHQNVVDYLYETTNSGIDIQQVIELLVEGGDDDIPIAYDFFSETNAIESEVVTIEDASSEGYYYITYEKVEEKVLR